MDWDVELLAVAILPGEVYWPEGYIAPMCCWGAYFRYVKAESW